MLQDVLDLYYNNLAKAWTPDPEHVRRLNCPVISQAAPMMMEQPDRDTFLYRAFVQICTKVYYRSGAWKWNPQYQKQGTCGGQSGKIAWDIGTAYRCLAENAEFPGRCSVAGMYGGSRVEIGRQPGKWQGTCGSWLAELCGRLGVVLLKDLNIEDNYYVPNGQDQDETLALAWARSAGGIPANYEQNASYASGIVTQPRNAREVGKLIQTGTPCIVGCDLIPTGKRDRNGFSQLQKVSGHLTAYVAVRYNPFGLLYLNSWGLDWASGGIFPEDQPPCSVWLDEDQANAQIQQNDTFGIGGTSKLKSLYVPGTKLYVPTNNIVA